MTEMDSLEPAVKYKIAVVLREDLQGWQKLNVTAFLVSGITAGAMVQGLTYYDKSGYKYLPMFQEPVMTYSAPLEGLRSIADRARVRDIPFAIFTDELFLTYDDEANRQAVSAFYSEDLNLAGLAFRCPRNAADKLLKGYKLMS
ncbi:DUF2000 family protein [Pseudomonas sp. NPDC088368]|uniref:DUF2000 family protein n=1 Tax=Pseudomonas sp. NPDC088368 TaxID=3364453 RepID=UPI00381019D0